MKGCEMEIPEFLQIKFSFWNGGCTLSAVCAAFWGGGKRTFKAIFAQPGWFCAIYLPIFGPIFVSTSTPYQKTATPNFFSALTFSSHRRGFCGFSRSIV